MLKLQLLTCYFHFKNLPCSTNNLLTVKADRISVALNISGISRAIALDILNVFFLTKLSFTLVMVRSFFLLIHFLVVEDYELCKITSYILSVPLTLECIKILSSSISFFFFYFNCINDDVLCKTEIWADDTALNSSCDWPSGLLQQVVIWSQRHEHAILEISKCDSVSNHLFIFRKLFYIYKLIHVDLKPRILITLTLLTPLLNNYYYYWFFRFIGLVF